MKYIIGCKKLVIRLFQMKIFITIAMVAGLFATQATASAQDEETLAAGKRAYNKCRACHTLTDTDKPRPGPHLENIFGRGSASVDSFKYSQALKDANLVWDEATLDTWLQSPRKFLPGNRMTFVGIRNENERKALLAYLKANTSTN